MVFRSCMHLWGNGTKVAHVNANIAQSGVKMPKNTNLVILALLVQIDTCYGWNIH